MNPMNKATPMAMSVYPEKSAYTCREYTNKEKNTSNPLTMSGKEKVLSTKPKARKSAKMIFLAMPLKIRNKARPNRRLDKR